MSTDGVTSQLGERPTQVVVALSGAPSSEHLVRSAARLARQAGVPLVGAHGRAPDAGGAADTAAHRRLLEDLGATYREVDGPSVAAALRAVGSQPGTHLVVGETRRSTWERMAGRSVVEQVGRFPDVQVHLVPPEHEHRRSIQRYRSPALGRTRLVTAWLLVVVGVPVLVAALAPFRRDDTVPSALLLVLLLTVVTAAVGGVAPALAAAFIGFVGVNYFLTPPFHTLDIANSPNLIALVTYLAVAAVVGGLVGQGARRSAEAVRARSEAEALARAAGSLAGAPDPVRTILERLVATLGLAGASLLVRDGQQWTAAVRVGDHAPLDPLDATTTWPTTPGVLVALAGGPVDGAPQSVLGGFVAQVTAALEQQSLREAAAAAGALEEADRLRTALLRSVSHDLRTPLASIKASVTSLLQDDIEWSAGATKEFLLTIAEETDRLDHLVGNLLDMGRLQAGALRVATRPTLLEEAVPAALTSLSTDTGRVVLDVDEDAPRVDADPALLERAVANVVSNALSWSPPGSPVTVDVVEDADVIRLRIIDHGPGVAPADRERVLEPFQRLGDRSTEAGAGLGLAVAKGFVEAMRGQVELSDTPGGGLTVTFVLRRSGR